MTVPAIGIVAPQSGSRPSTQSDALVYLHLRLPGLRDGLDLPASRMIDEDDRPDDETRARVRVLVTGGPEHLPTVLVESFPCLELIVAVAAGHEGIDLEHARSLGIRVTSSIGVNAADVADVAIGALLALVRGIVDGDRLIRDGEWESRRVVPTRSIGSLKIGIVGLGHIGQNIAHRMAAFGCAVAWFGPREKDVPYPRISALIDLAAISDVLFVAAHLSTDTAGLIDPAVLTALGPQGYLVNVGRGALVDEDALIAALRNHTIAGAALDVFVDEPTPPERWRSVPKTVLTPHIGGVTHESMRGVIDRARESVRRGLTGETIETWVA